jgi:predicted Fe-S protein YdhL (DUF1289 family)
MNDGEPRSPCISICVLDERDVCTGCYRTAREITDWFMATGDQRREILRKAHERMQACSNVRLE